MTISIIAAIASNRVIGQNGRLPWYLPDDLKRFKSLTMGHHLLMGRKTYQSIGRPLPGRVTIVLSRQDLKLPEGVLLAHSLAESLRPVPEDRRLFVVGGAEVYKECLPFAHRLYLTMVQADFQGDVLFPEYNSLDWDLVEKEDHPVDDRHSVAFSFQIFERKTPAEDRISALSAEWLGCTLLIGGTRDWKSTAGFFGYRIR